MRSKGEAAAKLFLPAVGVSRKNRKIISLVSGKEFLAALCFQAYPSIGLSKSGDIPGGVSYWEAALPPQPLAAISSAP